MNKFAAPQVVLMAEQEAGTKTIRVAANAANKLQTISALSTQMGERFKPVEFVNGLIEKPIDDLYDAIVKRFTEFQAKRKPKPPKP